jgi:hypothetical protein
MELEEFDQELQNRGFTQTACGVRFPNGMLLYTWLKMPVSVCVSLKPFGISKKVFGDMKTKYYENYGQLLEEI